ncbi:MAG: nitrophenyl compound nitroreductase subunit ArsF family protein [Phycisphaerae bacterium]|nr:nitrophenyl compound nitroreductase subunit ArsF family protein [Phycisphaerae bacterium]
MNKDKTISVLKYALLSFVLVTIGFAIGKEVTLRRVAQGRFLDATPVDASVNQVVVSYAHATIRCVSCNTIERLVQETLDEQFAEAVALGNVVFQEVNFQEDTAFAKQYEIVANCVVLRQIQQGQETQYQRLDKVWELYEDAPAFKQYLGDAIRSYLGDLPGGDA